MKEVNKVLLFDGVCNLCNGVVQFIINNESTNDLFFTSLQSEFGKELLKKYHIDNQNIDSIVYLENNKAFIKSSAVLKVSTNLKSPWKHFSVLTFIPKPIGDYIYSIVAKNRYNLFGKNDSCWLPNQELTKRFL